MTLIIALAIAVALFPLSFFFAKHWRYGVGPAVTSAAMAAFFLISAAVKPETRYPSLIFAFLATSFAIRAISGKPTAG